MKANLWRRISEFYWYDFRICLTVITCIVALPAYYVLSFVGLPLAVTLGFLWWCWTYYEKANEPKLDFKRFNVLVVGAGFSGICMGVKLKKQGIPFVIVEKSNNPGGTWWDNKYPGCAVDVVSVLYQYSFFMRPNWSSLLAPRNEIVDYLEATLTHFKLWDHLKLDTKVKCSKWVREKKVWEVTITNDGQDEVLFATHIVSACGALRVPNIPDFKGLEDFSGQVYHSSKLDNDLVGKKVGLVGNGTSAAQIAPAIAKKVKKLIVFQRTPNWQVKRWNPKINRFIKMIFAYFPISMKFFRVIIYLLYEMFLPLLFPLKNANLNRFNRFMLTTEVKRQLKGNEEIFAKAIPDFPIGCKRFQLVSDYWPIFVDNKHVHLEVDPIDEITKDAIMTKSGTKHEVDVIVFSTGFKIEESICGFDVEANGFKIINHLKNEEFGGKSAYNSVCVEDFPNFFILLGPNGVLAHTTVVYMIECQANYVLDILKKMAEYNIASVDVKPEVVRKFEAEMDEKTSKLSISSPSCSSWYKNSAAKNRIIWPASTLAFYIRTRTANLLRDFNLDFVQQKD